jgi:hypothetical protein
MRRPMAAMSPAESKQFISALNTYGEPLLAADQLQSALRNARRRSLRGEHTSLEHAEALACAERIVEMLKKGWRP